MNWFQKISSITFGLEGGDKISQPKDLFALSYDLTKYVQEQTGKWAGHNIIPDGDTDNSMTGTINWYVSDIPEDVQKQIMQSWIEDKQLMDYQIQVSGPEVSGMSQSAENPLMVYRIHILKNGSEDFMKIPSINLANGNAEALIKALDIPFDWSGDISLHELQNKLEMFHPFAQQELIQAPESGGEEGKVQWFSGGCTEDQVNRYVNSLQEMVTFGLQNGFNTLTWV